ncbi:MAG: ribonuclease Y [Anaerolineae bacterium]|nr:ribonuclease Y [Anaerolineae bacterium]MDW8068229.1 ribonuclease Y [Anaerolineae bacterium]
MTVGFWISLLIAIGIGIGIGYGLAAFRRKSIIREAREEAQRILEEANNEAQRTLLAAQDQAMQVRTEAQGEIERWRNHLRREEERLQQRREKLDQRQEALDKREQALNKRQSALDRQRNELERLQEERTKALEEVARMSMEEAREELLRIVAENTRQEMARVIREIEQEAREEGERRARKILTTVIQRMAGEQVAELTVSSVDLPSDEMKGRIIGRGGRNIRTFEQVAGVDVVVDDTPETITISCFDPVRREVARRAMERLITDGRIHPGRIEKVVADARKEVEQQIREEGERAVYESGVASLHPELVKLLGKLRFRTSYGQNQHAHAIETAKLAAMLAAELGANVEVARLGGLLHDIGKAVDFEVEGTHALIGAEICRRYGVPEEVVHCIESHHHEADQQSLEAIIVEVADAISGARPGARRESLEQYIKRIRALEELASSFPGVAESFAIQAGREIRIIVKPEDVDDLGAIQLSRDIARKIEESMEYPGQIKVTVIRETRAVDYAK